MTADEIGQMLRAASADTEPLRERVAELEDLLADVAMFFDGWFMPDDECQSEADALLARAQKLLSDERR